MKEVPWRSFLGETVSRRINRYESPGGFVAKVGSVTGSNGAVVLTHRGTLLTVLR